MNRFIFILINLIILGYSSLIWASPVNISINRTQFCDYLADDLWEKRDASDAANVLRIPLEYAFLTNDKQLKDCFANYIKRLSIQKVNVPDDISVLSRLEHLQLISRYIVLNNDAQYIPWIKEEFEKFWSHQDAWLWGRKPFKGIGNRIRWKLDSSPDEVKESFHRVIFDEDYFALAIGMDLYGLLNRLGKLESCVSCLEAKELYLRVFSERGYWEQERWMIDVDLWATHPDFSYAAYLKEPKDNSGNNLESIIVKNITIDSSHASRFPTWLRSGELALQGEELSFIIRLKKGLTNQLKDKVLIKDTIFPVPLLNNFMSGHNGYYRYGYATQTGYFKGYAPYALSGTFAYGGWSLLGSELSEPYRMLSEAYPLTHEALHIYQDTSSREKHPIIATGWTNGLMSDLAKMAFVVSQNF